MAEREFNLAKKTDRLPVQPTLLPERLVLSYRGRVHFQEAIAMAATTKGSDVMNAVVGVARNMVEVGIPPAAALDLLISIRNGISTDNDPNGEKKRNRSFMELGMAKMLGMLGRHDEMSSLLTPPEKDHVLWTISPYLLAGEEQIRRGEDPTSTLEEAMDRIARNQTHWDNHFGKTIEYVGVARVFHRAGLDPKIAFSRAEKVLDVAGKRSTGDFSGYRSYKELGVGYAACGLDADALRMVDLIGETAQGDEGRNWEISQALQAIAQEHLSQGNYEAAVVAARRLNWDRFTAKMLARKAVGEARQGINAIPTINEAVSVIKDAKDEDAYEEVYPLIGLALERPERNEETQTMFRKIKGAIDNMDVLYKAGVGFELAKAIDEAGYKAEKLYRKSFAWADQFRTEEPGWGSMGISMSWAMHEHGISNLIASGCFDLAEKYLAKYPDDGWSKSGLIGDLAKAKVERGLSQTEIESLNPSRARELLSGDKQTRQAALYFGLNKLSVS